MRSETTFPWLIGVLIALTFSVVDLQQDLHGRLVPTGIPYLSETMESLIEGKWGRFNPVYAFDLVVVGLTVLPAVNLWPGKIPLPSL